MIGERLKLQASDYELIYTQKKLDDYVELFAYDLTAKSTLYLVLARNYKNPKIQTNKHKL